MTKRDPKPTSADSSNGQERQRGPRDDRSYDSRQLEQGQYYCGMCEKWFKRGGDCRLCGYRLEKGTA